MKWKGWLPVLLLVAFFSGLYLGYSEGQADKVEFGRDKFKAGYSEGHGEGEWKGQLRGMEQGIGDGIDFALRRCCGIGATRCKALLVQ